jgi:hypothetical protein
VQLLELGVEHVVDRAELLLALVVRDLEHGLLCSLDEVPRRGLVLQHAGLDLHRRRQEIAPAARGL